MSAYSVILFYSTAHAIRAEKVLQQAGFPMKMIPTPRQISSDCGMALRFDRSDREAVTASLQESNVPINGIHDI